MKKRLCCFILLGMGIMLATVALSGNADQAKQQAQAQASQADVSLLLRPDLAMGKIWIVKAGLTTLTHPPLPVTVLKKGEKYLFYCQYSNPGRALNGFWKLGYYIDGQMVMNQYWGDVPAGATQTKYADVYPDGGRSPHLRVPSRLRQGGRRKGRDQQQGHDGVHRHPVVGPGSIISIDTFRVECYNSFRVPQ